MCCPWEQGWGSQGCGAPGSLNGPFLPAFPPRELKVAWGELPGQPPGFHKAAEIRQNAGKVGKIKSSRGFLPFQIVVASFFQWYKGGSIIFPAAQAAHMRIRDHIP